MHQGFNIPFTYVTIGESYVKALVHVTIGESTINENFLIYNFIKDKTIFSVG